jgi:hypothetical protein
VQGNLYAVFFGKVTTLSLTTGGGIFSSPSAKPMKPEILPSSFLIGKFGNIVVTRIGDSGTSKGAPFVYASDVERYISNSGDLTRDKIAKPVEMVIDTAGN